MHVEARWSRESQVVGHLPGCPPGLGCLGQEKGKENIHFTFLRQPLPPQPPLPSLPVKMGPLPGKQAQCVSLTDKDV